LTPAISAVCDYFAPREVFSAFLLGTQWISVLNLGGSRLKKTAATVADVFLGVTEAFALPDFFVFGKQLIQQPPKKMQTRAVVNFVGNCCDVMDYAHSRLKLISCSSILPGLRTVTKVCALYGDVADAFDATKIAVLARCTLLRIKSVISVALTAVTVYDTLLKCALPQRLKEVRVFLNTAYFVTRLAYFVHEKVNSNHKND